MDVKFKRRLSNLAKIGVLHPGSDYVDCRRVLSHGGVFDEDYLQGLHATKIFEEERPSFKTETNPRQRCDPFDHVIAIIFNQLMTEVVLQTVGKQLRFPDLRNEDIAAVLGPLTQVNHFDLKRFTLENGRAPSHNGRREIQHVARKFRIYFFLNKDNIALPEGYN